MLYLGKERPAIGVFQAYEPFISFCLFVVKAVFRRFSVFVWIWVAVYAAERNDDYLVNDIYYH